LKRLSKSKNGKRLISACDGRGHSIVRGHFPFSLGAQASLPAMNAQRSNRPDSPALKRPALVRQKVKTGRKKNNGAHHIVDARSCIQARKKVELN
jgi:hypothetical protein